MYILAKDLKVGEFYTDSNLGLIQLISKKRIFENKFLVEWKLFSENPFIKLNNNGLKQETKDGDCELYFKNKVLSSNSEPNVLDYI